MIELRGYIDEKGNKRFANWLEGLDASAAAKVTIALTRMEQGNFSNAKGVGTGVYECRIDFGPGYRIYFGKDSESPCHSHRRGHEETATKGYRRGAGMLGGL
jgi:putative addiction module killer protein